MRSTGQIIILILFIFGLVPAASATQIRAYVAEFAVTGGLNKEELKLSLPTMLASRLSGKDVLAVDAPAGADVIVKGSYVVFGKVFSIDVVARDRNGKVVARAFQQGESQDELIPALGKLGKTLADELARLSTPAGSSPASPVVSVPSTVQLPRPVGELSAASEIVRPEQVAKATGAVWTSQKIAGALVGIAPGLTLENGKRELYVAGERDLRFYRQEEGLKLIAEVTFPGRARVLGVDTADLDGDGIPEAYVTIMDGDSLSSEVWVGRQGKLVRLAAGLPYFFRGMALDGKNTRIYAQQSSTDASFYGDVFEIVRSGDRYEARNPFKLPRFGYLYNFNRFVDAAGKPHFVVLNEDGYLIVYGPDGEEAWRSGDKYGGSESNFKREDLAAMRVTGDPNRWTFLEQRISVTPDGEIIVPKSEGLFVVGNNRSYKKNSVFAFAWTGAALDERWHTKQSQNYLADYYYDSPRKELVLLEVVKKEGLLAKGASTVTVKRVE